MNPNWIRTGIASVLLAILLRAGLGVPVITTFLTIAIIYVMHVVMVELGTGLTTAWSWAKTAANVGIGVVIFLALRFLAAKFLGVYPADTFATTAGAGGIKNIALSHDAPTVLLWELVFALVAGGLSVAWAQGKSRKLVGTVFVASLVVLSFQLALPTYAETFRSREEIDQSLAENGVWRTVFPKKPSTSVQVPVPAPAGPLDECSTPCAMHVGWDVDIKSGGRPYLVKFNGKDWLARTGVGGDTLTLDQFNPGEAQFASPENDPSPVQMELYAAK